MSPGLLPAKKYGKSFSQQERILKQHTAQELKQLNWDQKLELSAHRIKYARTQMLLNNPLWGVLCLFMKLVPNKGLNTVATDGKNFLFDPDYLLKESDEDIQFDLKHEVSHIILHHLLRGKTRTAVVMLPSGPSSLFNIAADYAIHSMFALSGEYLPDNVLHDTKFDKMSAEAIYDQLLKEAKKNQKPMSGGQQGEGIPGGQGNEDGNASGQGANSQNGKQGKGNAIGYIDTNGQKQHDSHSEWGKASAQSQKEAMEQAKQWQDRVGSAIATAKAAGKLPASLEAWATELLDVKVDWRTLTRRFISKVSGGGYVWHKPNRRYLHQDIILPGMESSYLRLFVLLDTSGSMSDEAITDMMTETQGSVQHLDNYDLHLAYFDAEPYLEEHFSPTNPFELPKGLQRGGTSFQRAFDYAMTEMLQTHGKPDLILIFTDGYDCYPQESIGVPTIALLTEDHDATPDWIDAIQYSECD